MIIDVVSIFPEYLAPLTLSLPGRATESGLLELRTHDLRRWTHDRHRTVDDTPYGGGAGMVMRPEPWGEALDDLLADGPAPRLLVMTPSGRTFTQADAERLSHEERLVFACGRYEGIDARVAEWAAERMPVEEVSIGDYVLNGGEVAAMVCIEAIVRLLPGFMGNPDSIVEESHTGVEPLLEHPCYTKPPTWRGHAVPDVLFSGDHARIARWRAEQAAARTRARRPDLWTRVPALPPLLSAATPEAPQADGLALEVATPAHADRPGADALGLATVDLDRWSARHAAGVELTWVATHAGAPVAVVRALPRGPERPGEVEVAVTLRGDRPDLERPLRRLLSAWLAGWPAPARLSRRWSRSNPV